MFYLNNLQEMGVRIGDEMELCPLFGKKKTLRLMLTELIFVDEDSNDSSSPGVIKLPSFEDDHFRLKISLDPFGNHHNEGRYLIESLSKRPFRLNGQWCFKSYLMRGDKIQIAGNSFNFIRKVILSNGVSLPERVVNSDLNILIEGETGTGKTYLAKKIHEKSKRPGSFVHLNLASYSKHLLESELFGYVKGAFTGANSDKDGAFKHSEEGTLFLDEVDSLPYEFQTKLLLFLDDKNFRKVGDTKLHSINTRLIFASGKSISKLVKEGLFRKDFYYRVNSGYYQKLLSLRESPGFFNRVLDQYCEKHSLLIDPDLKDFYKGLQWPGNLRQLYAHLNKKKTLSLSKHLVFDELDEELNASKLVSDTIEETPVELSELNFHYVHSILKRCSGDKEKTCEILNVSKYVLNKILKTA